jgi:hypothetical protein
LAGQAHRAGWVHEAHRQDGQARSPPQQVADAPEGAFFTLHPSPMFQVTEAIEGMEKGYCDLQKPCQPRSAVFIVANLLYITYNSQM